LKVSIIIRTKNEGKALPEVLRKIKKQAYGGEAEIIVVDSGSTDNTLSSAREAGCSVIELPQEKFSFGRSINEGVKKATGGFIVLLSGHTLPADEIWLKELIKGFDDRDTAAVFGRQVPVKGFDPFEEWQFYRNFPSKISFLRSLPLRGDTFSNANCAIRREILLKYPFDETLPGSEDREWAGRIKKYGFKIKYIPESRVFHSHPLSYRAVYDRKFIQANARKLIYPKACRYDNILWLSGAVVTTLLIDAGYCLFKGYFKFLPKIFPYRYHYFRGIIDGVRKAKND
jgi:glycosyltransferase involved in cell wall biosynthesis